MKAFVDIDEEEQQVLNHPCTCQLCQPSLPDAPVQIKAPVAPSQKPPFLFKFNWAAYKNQQTLAEN